MSKVAVIGGCGRSGLRISLISANKGHKVTIIDIANEKINELKQGNLPFIEAGAEIFLEEALKNKSLTLSMTHSALTHAEIIIITIDTPVDSNLNPSLEPVIGVILDASDYIKEDQLIIFRGTISPKITKRIKNIIEEKTGLKVGKNIFLAFCPEILDEAGNINSLLTSCQPIGIYDEKSFKKAEDFFSTITKGKISRLTPLEALLAKLMSNMFTYIKGACTNEFYLISESYGANIHKILGSLKSNLAPNPNSAGPGMHKEGWFLVDRIPFSELITTAFKINESMPACIVKKLEEYKIKKVAILGMASKANSDETRASLSYKLRKILFYEDYEVACFDPYLPEFSDPSILQNSDAIILMTPHKEFQDLEKIVKLIKNYDCLVIDLHGFWKESREIAQNGVYKFSELKTKGGIYTHLKDSQVS